MCFEVVIENYEGIELPKVIIPCHLSGSFNTNQFHAELRDCIDGVLTPIALDILEELLDWLYRGRYVKRTTREVRAREELIESLETLAEISSENMGILQLKIKI